MKQFSSAPRLLVPLVLFVLFGLIGVAMMSKSLSWGSGCGPCADCAGFQDALGEPPASAPQGEARNWRAASSSVAFCSCLACARTRGFKLGGRDPNIR